MCKVGWNWFNGSGGEVLTFVNVFPLFCYFVIITTCKKKGGVFIEQIGFSLTQGCVVPGWIWLFGSGRRLLSSVNVPSLIFVFISNWTLFELIWILSTYGCFVASLVKIGPVVLEKMKRRQRQRQQRRRQGRTTDKLWSE